MVERGSLSARRWLDSSVVIDAVEEARDRLGLPPGDAARDLFELLLDRDAARQEDDTVRVGGAGCAPRWTSSST
jgi:hypothetical protein